MITKANILSDFYITIPLFIWVFFVIKYLSRWIYNFAVKKGYPPDSATYFGRKIVHLFGAGFVTLSIPFLFREPFLPFLSALILAIYTWFFHKRERVFQWFQIKNDFKVVDFSIMWGLSILIGWFFDKTFWLGVIPALFMSFGDGVSGIVRNLKYKKRSKAWEGSLAMLVCCVIIGGLKIGLIGIIAAILATVVEKAVPADSDILDDNILIPLVSFLILFFFK